MDKEGIEIRIFNFGSQILDREFGILDFGIWILECPLIKKPQIIVLLSLQICANLRFKMQLLVVWDLVLSI
jgi:hypothetical protein